MLPAELLELARAVCRQKAESQTLELKSARGGCPKRLYDTLSSFSNQDGGGVLLFGIDESEGWRVVGVYDPQDLQQKVAAQCAQMEPPVRAVFTLAEWQEGVWLCAAEVPGLDLSERPCYYKGAGRLQGAYLRVGDADELMTDYELYTYEAFRKHQHDDERPVERAGLSMMDAGRLEEYLRQRRLDRPGFARLDRAQALELLNLTRGGVPTLACVLNFAIYPQGYFPQLGITAVVVPGGRVGDTAADAARFVDNRRIEGTLPDMVEEALAFCQRNMKVRTIIDPATGRRADRLEYPLAAIREAVLNALIHRDYSIYTEGTPVQIAFFSDRLEIRSPGGLYGRMTVEQLGVAHPDLRNPALAVMTEILTGAENRYSGIPTMRRALAEYGLPAPEFKNLRGEFVVTFYNAAASAGALEGGGPRAGAEDLLAFCRTPRTRQEIAGYLGVKTVFYAVQHYVKPLLAEGKLAMTLPDRPKSKNQKYYAP